MQDYSRRSRLLLGPPVSRGASRSIPGPRAKRGKCRRNEIRPRRNLRGEQSFSPRISPRTPQDREGPPKRRLPLWLGAVSSRLPQNPIHRLSKITGHKVWRRRPFLSVPGKLTLSVTCANKNAARLGIVCQLNVPITIPHHKRASQIDTMLV